MNISEKLFCKNIYTRNCFDKLCVETMDELNDDKIMENTKLYKILKLLENKEIYLWYGNEIEDLDEYRKV
jgi:hypothetical protein